MDNEGASRETVLRRQRDVARVQQSSAAPAFATSLPSHSSYTALRGSVDGFTGTRSSDVRSWPGPAVGRPGFSRVGKLYSGLPSSDMPRRFHPHMEHSHDLDQAWRIAQGSKVDHVAVLLVAAEPLGDIATIFPRLRVVAQPVEAAQQGIDVPIGLLEVPLLGGLDPDLGETRFRPNRKPKGHFFASRSRPAALIRSASFGNSSAS